MNRSVKIVETSHKTHKNNTKMVILWGSNNLLTVGFESYLKEINDWEVIRVSNEQSFDYLMGVVVHHHPHTIILSKEGCDNTSMFAQLLLQHCSELKVIILSLEDNFAEILTKRKVFMNNMEEFLSFIN